MRLYTLNVIQLTALYSVFFDESPDARVIIADAKKTVNFLFEFASYRILIDSPSIKHNKNK